MANIEEFNEMVTKTLLLIREHFNNGCNGINCKECMLHKPDDEFADNLCTLIYHLGRDE